MLVSLNWEDRILAYSVGDTVTLDGIESLIVYDAGSEQSWGRYLCVDKNHA